jgi:hypothetical protein
MELFFQLGASRDPKAGRRVRHGGAGTGAPGGYARWKRATETPFALRRATSPAKRARSGSIDGPQTPVAQHSAGSRTRRVVLGLLGPGDRDEPGMHAAGP